jgi:hypothetical protein
MKHSLHAFFLTCVVAACGQGHAAPMDSARADSIARVRQDSINRAQPGYVVDSILPIDEQLRRFRASVPDTIGGLAGGATSRDQLVRSFVRSLEAADTVALIRLTISKAEFAWLVYPDSPLSAPPYQQAPDLVWMRHAAASGTGLKRLLARLAGTPLGFRGWRCGERPVAEGENRLWRDCVVTLSKSPRETETLQLFSSILGRDGRFKILSYDNAF